MIIIAVIWLIASIWFIHLAHDVAGWNFLFKLTIGIAIVCVLLAAGGIFNPLQSRFIGAAEINDTSNLAIIIGLVLAVCITGPIAAIYYFKWKKENNKNW